MRVCRVCQNDETKVEFKKPTICVGCNREYMKDYRKKNRSTIRVKTAAWKKANHAHYRTQQNTYHNEGGGADKQRGRYTKNPRIFLLKLLARIRHMAANPGPHEPKTGPRLEWDIDIDFLMGLWESQGGKCALTGLPMTHRHRDLYAVSVDRIDSTKGHVKGNVQLVCVCMNWAKRHYSNEALVGFLDSYFLARVERDGYRHYTSSGEYIPESA